ncbi:hypothetical protein [Citricoccus sp. GCM10030269]|uniref:hypothetical protein n=1 Tax=Citricoccus sp. GCM10030269 TaxID=3273388 RepID=UPI00361FC559
MLLDIIYSPVYLGMTAIVVAAVSVLLYVAWRCLNGDTRTWAVLPRLPFQVSRHNTWPFMLLMCGLALLTALPSVFFEAWDMEGARQATWNLFFIPLALVVLSFVWWPLAWTPAWFKDWARRARSQGDANPWTPPEIERVKCAPPSKRRQRALRDIARLVGKEEVEGLLAEDWLERQARHATETQEAAGITEDMDSIERALALKAHRRRQKGQQKGRG